MLAFVCWKYFGVSVWAHTLPFQAVLLKTQSPSSSYSPQEWSLLICFYSSSSSLHFPILSNSLWNHWCCVTYHSLAILSLQFLLPNHLLDIVVFHILLLLLQRYNLIVFIRFVFKSSSLIHLLGHLFRVLLVNSLSSLLFQSSVLLKACLFFLFSLSTHGFFPFSVIFVTSSGLHRLFCPSLRFFNLLPCLLLF